MTDLHARIADAVQPLLLDNLPKPIASARAADVADVVLAALKPELDALAALRQVSRGYCPDCGRGDAGPTADNWEQQRQRADAAEAALTRARDAARLHRQGLLSLTELYAVIGPALDTPEHAP